MNKAPSMLDNLDLRSHFDKLAAEQADQQSDAEEVPQGLLCRPVLKGLQLGAVMDNLTRDNVTLPDHYKRFKLEPIYFIGENSLDWFQGNIVKYVLRHRLKNGKEDLLKVIRYAQMYIKKEYEHDPDWAKAPAATP